MKGKLPRLLATIIALAGVYGLSLLSTNVKTFFENNPEHGLLNIFFVLSIVLALSFIVFYISYITAIPSFVTAIFFGIAGHQALLPIVEERELLGALVGFGATLILFGGGLETPFTNFKKLFWKIFSLSFPGLLITAFLFSVLVFAFAAWFHTPVSILAAVLLGAVLASTDPAAIIPVLKSLRFSNRSTKDIIVSESAVTDVTGTLLTVTFLALVTAGAGYTTITEWYGKIFSVSSGLLLLRQIIFGIVFGIIGYFFLEILQIFKKNHEREFEADSAIFLFIPVIIFTIALSFGGSGYLAAFIAGLLFNLSERLHETERFFNHIIEGFFKPVIFILLGALVDPRELLSYAGVGIVMSLVFMFVVRPLVVFAMLGPFSFFGKDRLNWRELLFISFVRETGAIPAVLMVTIASLHVGNISGLVAIGMWVILLTLIIEPILTPHVARLLKVAEPIRDAKAASFGDSPIVVVGTRGRSFVDRLPTVVDWSLKHAITRITVLLCLEQNYTEELSAEIAAVAKKEFAEINKKLKADGQSEFDFAFVSRTGFLQTNISELATNDAVTAIFVGRKMLDYRLSEIKSLRVPLYFIE